MMKRLHFLLLVFLVQTSLFAINAPTLSSPSNGIIVTRFDLFVNVSSVTGAKGYQFKFDTTPTFTSPWVKLDTNSASYIYSPELRMGKTYYWRAKCANSIDTGNWSAPFNFLTTQDVWLSNPTNGAVNIALYPKLEWGIQGSVSELRFQYQLSKDSLFTNVASILLPVNSSPSVTVTCEYATQYYWRARAFHPLDTSRWSGFYTFKTLAVPALGSVQLASPTNGLINVPVGPITLSWFNLTNALTYDVEVSDNQTFAIVLANGNTPSTGIYFSGTQANTRNYWRVRGLITALIGPWSGVRYFTTAPATGTLEMDADNAIKVFPNPAQQSFEIEFEGDFETRITDLQGKIILETKAKNLCQINFSEWEPGVYFLRLIKGNQCHIQKIVIQ